VIRTDEQAPIPEVFDHLLLLVWKQNQASSPGAQAIFNCQMGRGRTTTGMVIAVLLYLVRSHRSSTEILSSSLDAIELQSETESIDSDNLRYRYLAGEYKIIMNLLQVLEHGKLAKRLLDRAIDQCEAIQNLRKAIFDFKTHNSRSSLYDRERGLNYLLRYYYLIAFSEYLLEIDTNQPSPGRLFALWLSDRKEICNMVSRRDLIDFS